jgi:hypothetical protein
MSRRQLFTDTAAALAAIRPGLDPGAHRQRSQIERVTWERCCDAVADAFAKGNTAFDRGRFAQDCRAPQPGPMLGKRASHVIIDDPHGPRDP